MLTYRIDVAKRLVVFTGSGYLTAAEVMRAQDLLRADPNFDPAFGLLADYLEMTGSDLDHAKLQKMARNAPFGPTSRRAFVVRSKLFYGLVRMYGILSDLENRSGQVQVFNDDMEAAMRWLAEVPRCRNH